MMGASPNSGSTDALDEAKAALAGALRNGVLAAVGKGIFTLLRRGLLVCAFLPQCAPLLFYRSGAAETVGRTLWIPTSAP